MTKVLVQLVPRVALQCKGTRKRDFTERQFLLDVLPSHATAPKLHARASMDAK